MQSLEVRYHSGLEAERAVARVYLRNGYEFAAHRFRGEAGEIDLVLRQNDTVVFVEVKKSRSHQKAREALSSRQMARIISTATEYLSKEPQGLNTNTRFDVATVNWDGQVEIVENALAE